MKKTIPAVFALCCLANCAGNEKPPTYNDLRLNKPDRVSGIGLPDGFKRITVDPDSFGEWLRNINLKKDSLVYLYDGSLKEDQTIQFAVMDIPIGHKNLQQCADAVMRLRAEYLFEKKRYDEISFTDNAGKEYKWTKGNDRKMFERYLESVFGWCGSASLEKQLKPVTDIKNIQPGDVFIRGGFPGHAMIVADMAQNEKGEKAFLLAQSYMPAQSIHIVKNPLNNSLSPWYTIRNGADIVTPEWIFSPSQLRTW